MTYFPKEAGTNLLHNGAMQVHQRGTSTATAYPTGFTASGYYTADRWSVGLSGLGTWTQTVENDAPTGSGFRKSLKMKCYTSISPVAASDALNVRHMIEGQNVQSVKKGTASAEPLSLSFWVKSNKTGVYIAELMDVDNGRSVSATYTVDAYDTWEQKTITFPADTTGALDNNNEESLTLRFWLGAGSNNTSGTLATSWGATVEANRAVGQTNLGSATNQYWQITGVQLETGVQTPYEHKEYGQELRECQRYYYRLDPQQTYSPIGVGTAVSTTAAHVMINFPVQMRTSPGLFNDTSGTASDYALLLGSTISLINVPQIQHRNLAGANLAAVVSSGLTTGRAYLLIFNGTDGYLGFSADL